DRAEAYEQFASETVQPGDAIISFNYDVSLERELARTNKWSIGDGYGFDIPEFPKHSAVKIYKLHGSVNWLAVLFQGLTAGPTFFRSDNIFGIRPVFPSDELQFLGYSDLTDPAFKKPAAAVPVMIMPTRSKEFFFGTNVGQQWEWFWNQLWKQAAVALKKSQ